MLYTEEQKKKIDRVREVFAELLKQSPDYEILWSDKVGYVWLEILCKRHLEVDTAMRIDSAENLCRELLTSIATDVLLMTKNEHGLDEADPLELAEIKKRWKPYIGQLPEYAYLCDELQNGE